MAVSDIVREFGDDADAGRKLVHELCAATRAEDVSVGAFANEQAHAAYSADPTPMRHDDRRIPSHKASVIE